MKQFQFIDIFLYTCLVIALLTIISEVCRFIYMLWKWLFVRDQSRRLKEVLSVINKTIYVKDARTLGEISTTALDRILELELKKSKYMRNQDLIEFITSELDMRQKSGHPAG